MCHHTYTAVILPGVMPARHQKYIHIFFLKKNLFFFLLPAVMPYKNRMQNCKNLVQANERLLSLLASLARKYQFTSTKVQVLTPAPRAGDGAQLPDGARTAVERQ